MSTTIHVNGELIGETGDLEVVGPNLHLLEGGGYRRTAEIILLRGAGCAENIYMPIQFLGHVVPRKHWVREKDWEQRAPRRKRR